MVRRLFRAFLAAAVAAVLLAFPFGPLFPWSPWKPGYRQLKLQRSTIVYPENQALPAAFREFDAFIAESEKFHRLPVEQRITVILCRSWEDFRRFMPVVRGQGVGAVVLQTGTALYVTPRLAERGFDYAEFLRHELSHATLHQHQTLWQAHASSKAQWLFEGLAVSFGRQKAYVSAPEFIAFTKARDLVAVIDPARARPDLPSDMRFNYQVWRYFLEYLIDTHGRDRFQDLLVGMMREPDASEPVFQAVYGTPMPEAIRAFQRAVRAGTWLPRP